jgi:hypothetical protein
MGVQFGGMPRRQQQQQNRQPEHPLGQLAQFLPILFIMILTFFNGFGDDVANTTHTATNRYFSLTPIKPNTNPLTTKLTAVKDIPYYVSDQFLRTVARDRYQLSQVERMVENSYRTYLQAECKAQRSYKKRLETLGGTATITTQQKKKKDGSSNKNDAERANIAKKAASFELTRCIELEDLFPQYIAEKDRVNVKKSTTATSREQQQQHGSEF